jgi:hypothetical protein
MAESEEEKKKRLSKFKNSLARLRKNTRESNQKRLDNVKKMANERRARDTAQGRQGLNAMDTAYQKRNALKNNMAAAMEENGGSLTAEQSAAVREQTANQLANLDLNNYYDQLNNNGRGQNAFSQARAASRAPESIKAGVRVAKSIRRDLRLARRNAIRRGDRMAAANINIKSAQMGIPVSGGNIQAGNMEATAASGFQANLMGRLTQQIGDTPPATGLNEQTPATGSAIGTGRLTPNETPQTQVQQPYQPLETNSLNTGGLTTSRGLGTNPTAKKDEEEKKKKSPWMNFNFGN